jgi:hypothetical protein
LIMNEDIGWRSRRRLIAIALLAIGGCGGSHSTGSEGIGAAGGGISAAEYPARHVAARCQFLVACGFAPDLDTCVAASLPHFHEWSTPTFQRDVAAGKIDYDPRQAAACLAAFDGATCTKTWEATFAAASQACDKVFTGRVATGAACLFDEECKPGAGCNRDPGALNCTGLCCPGTCLDRFRTVPLGATCSDVDSSMAERICEFGAYCNFSATPRICVAKLKGVGTPCTAFASNPCAAPLFCSEVTNTCVSPSLRGGPCDPNGDDCEDELDFCDESSATCVAGVAVGAFCSLTTRCAFGSECIGDGAQLTCVTPLPAGADCSGENSPCLLDLVCDSTTHTCVLPQDHTCQ